MASSMSAAARRAELLLGYDVPARLGAGGLRRPERRLEFDGSTRYFGLIAEIFAWA